MSAGHKWRPLERATIKDVEPPRDLLELVMRKRGLNEAAARAVIDDEGKGAEYWMNDLYQVEVTRDPEQRGWVHLNIRRRDGYPGRDWRHFQQIKNELVGPECEAIELYPAESRLVDETNKYHLWAIPDPTFRFPCGWSQRTVDFDQRNRDAPGLRQRPAMQMAKAQGK